MNTLINVLLSLVGAFLAVIVILGGTVLVAASLTFGVGLASVLLTGLVLIGTLLVAVFVLFYGMMEIFDKIKW